MAIFLWDKPNGKRIKLADDSILAGLPIGATISYVNENAPRGFLPYDGSTYLRSDYPELYEKVPASWKINETQFTIPNAKGRTIQGADGNLGELIEAGLPNITGIVSGIGGAQVPTGAFYSDSNGNVPDGSWSNRRIVKYDASKGETKTDGTLKTADEHHVFGASDTVQTPAIALYYFIKATNYTDAPLNVIDDQKFTADNVLSAKKVKEELDQRSNYSTEETVIGTFLGKPLYRIMFNILNNYTGTNWGDTGINVSSLNIDKLIHKEVISNISNTRTHAYQISKIETDGKVYVASLSNTNIAITPSDFFVIEYTKTTD